MSENRMTRRPLR